MSDLNEKMETTSAARRSPVQARVFVMIRTAFVCAGVCAFVCSIASASAQTVSTITASSNDGNVPQNAVDGVLSTRWSCAIPSGGSCWIQADFGSAQTLSTVSIAWYQGNTRSNTFRIDVSADLLSFRNIYAGTSSGTTTGFEGYAFATTSARYVKIFVTDNSLHNGWASISELKISGSSGPSDAGMMDVFKIKKLYASVPSGPTWDSRHWSNGQARDIIDRDPYDPTHVSQQRGSASRLYVDGRGTLYFFSKGSGLPEPRLYLNDIVTHFFKNVELTVYYLRISDDNTPWGGLVIGARSGSNGHSSSGSYCDAHTYYGRFRHDATKDFEKELKHPNSQPKQSSNIWGGARTLPRQWIGMKFIIYNVNANKNVKMELYRDMTGGVNGGTWEKIGEIIDSGGWAPTQSTPICSYARDYIPATGGGVIILRNTGSSEAQYKWFSAREIVPPLP